MKPVHPLVLMMAGAGLATAAIAQPVPGTRANDTAAADDGSARLQGVAACAAAACHNANGPPASKGSEYSTWAAYDPHARAYSVLFEPRSVQMVKNLKLQEGRPQYNDLCLGCHVYPNLSEKTPRTERFSPSDGVGCEACHGAAEKWLATHYQRKLTEAEKSRLGMIPTKDLRIRAEVCVRCHVGDGEMDVNHDLIAAGHPRLRFEYGAYLASYPGQHWKTSEDRQRHPDLEARAWMIGQLVSAEAALQLLAHRASHVQDDAGKPWPEFAEYECAACHHSLTGDGERQRRAFDKGPVGTLRWGTWYYPVLPVLDQHLPGKGTRDLVHELDHLMRARIPQGKLVAQESGKAASVVRGWLADLANTPITKDHYQELLSALARVDQAQAEQDRPLASWDGATQLYLGLAALQHGLRDLNSGREVKPGLKDALLDLRRHLEEAFPDGRDKIYNSPSRFDPRVVATQLQRIHERLK